MREGVCNEVLCCEWGLCSSPIVTQLLSSSLNACSKGLHATCLAQNFMGETTPKEIFNCLLISLHINSLYC